MMKLAFLCVLWESFFILLYQLLLFFCLRLGIKCHRFYNKIKLGLLNIGTNDNWDGS